MNKDADCPGDAICDGGQCVDASGNPVQEAAPPAATPAPGQAAPGVPGVTPAPAVAVSASVEFIPRSGTPAVTDVASGQSCSSPCTLSLPTGTRSIRVGPPGAGEQPIEVLPTGGRLSIGEVDGVFIIGLVLFIPGLLAASGALVAKLVTLKDEQSTQDDVDAVALPIAIGGAVVMVPGLVMALVGDNGNISAAQNGYAPRVAAAPLPDGGYVSLQWAF